MRGLSFLAACALAAIIGALFFQVRIAEHDVAKLKTDVAELEKACGPVDTGGGVTQCAQPNMTEAPPLP